LLSPGGTASEATLPRQWTPLRRGKTGKNRYRPALFAQQFDICFSREVSYVMRSHLASEIVQGIMRTAVREDPTAHVEVFLPIGEDTALAVSILRELPGAPYG